MDIFLDPPRGVGDLLLGMSLAEGEMIQRKIEGYIPPEENSTSQRGFAHYRSEMSIALRAGGNGTVRAIEVFRPRQDFRVMYDGISVFQVPGNRLLEQLSESVMVEVEDGGLSITAPGLLLAFWRATLPEGDDDEDGRFFESVLVAKPGYYGR